MRARDSYRLPAPNSRGDNLEQKQYNQKRNVKTTSIRSDDIIFGSLIEIRQNYNDF